MSNLNRAVVIGASVGGLLAARALSETYAEITLIDRDRLPIEATSRKAVPQGRQLHVLLARGRQALEELFPGLSDELASRGAPLVDLHGEVHWCNDGFDMLRAPSSLLAFGLSRPMLEHVLRQRVAAMPGVRIMAGHEVVDLITTPDRTRITGVRVRPQDSDAVPDAIEADLVVDAGGRASRTPVWLTALGYQPPEQEQVPVGVTYVTRTYQREPGQLAGMMGVLTNATPRLPRAGIVAPQEDGRFAVALSGMLGEEPPTDDEGMGAFADTLAAPGVAEIVRTAKPLSPPAKMRFPASVRRRYEQLHDFPDGYLVIADALCSFNPIYGQGMTVAALEALLLRRLLARRQERLAHQFFRRSAKIIDGPWSISVGTDLRFPEVPGRRTPLVRFVNAYVHRLHAAATADPVLGAAFLRVINLIDPPTALLAPGIMRRVVFGARPT
ncbi:MAG TPA: FAD-dependent monooxygenase [Micromonosporaceae bacterium]